MHLVVRQASHNDFELADRLCLNSDLETERKKEIWNLVWDEGNPFGVVVSDLSGRNGRRDLALLLGTYVHDFVLETVEGQEKPSAMQRLAVLSKSGRRPFVNREELGQFNGREGLNLMLTNFGWVGSDFHAEPAPNLRAMVCNAFAERHGGNRHRYVFGEVCAPTFAELAFRSGFRVLNDYGDWAKRAGAIESAHRPFLVGVSRSEALLTENQWLMRLFTYFPPRFHFTEHQRQILLLAREGYTDNEIAQLVGARPDAIKKRWAGIYERVNEIFPGLLPANGPNGRGQEKRRALLNHLRDRPEELRPYVRPAVAMARR